MKTQTKSVTSKNSQLFRWLKSLPTSIIQYLSFMLLLSMYLINVLINWVTSSRFFPTPIKNAIGPSFSKLYTKIVSLNRRSEVTINRISLIDLAIKNMLTKKSRTLITIGGMAVGIGAIVLLQSIGYGLQELVINRVTRLEELKQINVSPQIGSNIKITDETLATFNQISEVTKSLPQIALVGRINYQNSNTDVAVYGVTTAYLEESAIQTSIGKLFDSNDLTAPADQDTLENSPVLAEEDTVPPSGLTEIDPTEIDPSETPIRQVGLGDSAVKQAVVNRALLSVLGLEETEAINQTFEVVFVVVGSLLENSEEKLETFPNTYTIVGVSTEDDTPFMYVPFIDLRGIGVTNYSQVKVVVQDEASLARVREHIEATGFITASVVDTVSQIDSLFRTLRVVLAVVGLVAVTIAALGMFNTLTVSLLERTREVGFMKAMGMKSHEIKDLFLTESLLMGIFGGALGLLLGHLGGLIINLILSLFSWSQGGDYIDVSYIPVSLVIIVGVLSLFVGIFTGFYPARRATSISALNALRYE